MELLFGALGIGYIVDAERCKFINNRLESIEIGIYISTPPQKHRQLHKTTTTTTKSHSSN